MPEGDCCVKRVALVMHGGVGPPGSPHYVPAIRGLVERLSHWFDLTVYTRPAPGCGGESYQCGDAGVRCIGRRHDAPARAFVPAVIATILGDHRQRHFSLIHGLWGLPGGMAAVVAGRAAGIRSIVTILGGEAASLPDIGYGNMKNMVPKALTLWTLRTAGDLTALTHFQIDQLRRFGFSREERIHTIPFGSDIPAAAAGRRRNAVPPFQILHIGHLNRVKDQRTLLRAFRILSQKAECRLTIVGDGILHKELKVMARDLGIEHLVTFQGSVGHDRIGEILAGADLLLHSSLYEGEGVVFAEAAAAGVPICSTRVGLVADLSPAFAASASPGDAEGLALAAAGLLTDAARRSKVASHAQAWASVHTATWTAAQFARLYDGDQVDNALSAPYFTA
jgi:glycosyltransferase involved in cell wall biosynthesis